MEKVASDIEKLLAKKRKALDVSIFIITLFQFSFELFVAGK